MICQDCNHENPPGSNYCNRCGTRLEAMLPVEEDTQQTVELPREYAIPGSAEGRTVTIEDVLYGSPAAAMAALAAVGCIPQPQLQGWLNVPGVGKVARNFGVLANNLDTEEATQAGTRMDVLAFDPGDISRLHQAATAVTTRCERVLKNPDNELLRDKLVRGKVRFQPVNRVLARRIETDLAAMGMHLPWSIGGIDVAFGGLCARVLQGFGFVCYFGHLGRIEPVNRKAAYRVTRQVISVPFGVDGFHTWDAAITDDLIDEDVGLLIEVNSHPR